MDDEKMILYLSIFLIYNVDDEMFVMLMSMAHQVVTLRSIIEQRELMRERERERRVGPSDEKAHQQLNPIYYISLILLPTNSAKAANTPVSQSCMQVQFRD